MRQLIMNEEALLNAILTEPDMAKQMSIGYVIRLIGKRIFNTKITKREFVSQISEEMREFHFDVQTYQEYKMQSRYSALFDEFSKSPDKAALRKLKSIPLYQPELDKIMQLPTDQHKKLLVTIYLVARFFGGSGWVGLERKELFKLANISANSEKRDIMIYDLIQANVIIQNKKNTNLSIKIELIPEGDTVFEVSTMKDIGNQFLGLFKPGYMQCQNCGKVVKKRANNMRYCRKCASQIESESAKKRVQKNRETRNVTIQNYVK